VLFAFGSFFAYCLTAAFFLPCLYLASKCIALNFSRTSILGAALGAAAYIPFAWVEYRVSGFNSGPPHASFSEFLLRDWANPINWALFPAAGLLTAALYWFLVNKVSREVDRTAG
jgi:hypothetical protein